MLWSTQRPRRSTATAGETIRTPSYCSSLSRCGSPETTRSAFAATAHASTASSSGSSIIVGEHLARLRKTLYSPGKQRLTHQPLNSIRFEQTCLLRLLGKRVRQLDLQAESGRRHVRSSISKIPRASGPAQQSNPASADRPVRRTEDRRVTGCAGAGSKRSRACQDSLPGVPRSRS